MNKILLVILILVSISALASAQSDPTLKWKFTAKEGINSIYVSDLDGDGKIEIIAAASIDGMVYVIDNKGKIKWTYNVICPVSGVYAADLDNDGKQEVMMSSCEYLTITNSNGTKIGQIHSWRGIKDVYASDIDNDNFKEIIATINPSPYSNGISVIDKNGKKKWSYSMEDRPYSVYASDLNNDGNQEIIVGTSEKEGRAFKPGHVYVLNSSGDMLWKFKTTGGVNYVSASDIDNDGSEEILVGSYYRFYVLDKNGNERWNYTMGGYIYSAKTVDLDMDGNNEIVVGSNDLFVLDKNGNLIWKDRVGTEVYDILLEDIDNDGNPEILVGSDRIYIFGQKGNLDWKSDGYLAVKGVYAIDLDNDNFKEIVAGTLDKNLYAFDVVNYAKIKLADSYYEKAQNFYTATDYENASRYAHMAGEIYSEISNSDGISKSKLLVSQIEKLSERVGTDRIDADAFYKSAEDFYFSRQYMNASAYARKAKEKYSSIGDTEGISRSNSLIGNVNTGLTADASEYYKNATNRYNSGDYEGAISDTKKSMEIYAVIRDSDNLLKTSLLIAGIYSKLATKNYDSNNFAEALKYAQESKSIYSSIVNDNDSYKEELMQINILTGRISEKNINEFNPADSIKIIVVIGISIIILYLGIRTIRRNKKKHNKIFAGQRKDNFNQEFLGISSQSNNSDRKSKDLPKKIIKGRYKGAGLRITRKNEK